MTRHNDNAAIAFECTQTIWRCSRFSASHSLATISTAAPFFLYQNTSSGCWRKNLIDRESKLAVIAHEFRQFMKLAIQCEHFALHFEAFLLSICVFEMQKLSILVLKFYIRDHFRFIESNSFLDGLHLNVQMRIISVRSAKIILTMPRRIVKYLPELNSGKNVWVAVDPNGNGMGISLHKCELRDSNWTDTNITTALK